MGVQWQAHVQTGSKATAGPDVSLAILPFRNGSGDARLDWLGSSLADILSTDVGQSAHLRTISPDRLHQVLSDLQISPGTTIDPTMMGRMRSSAMPTRWFGDNTRIRRSDPLLTPQFVTSSISVRFP